MLKEKISLDTIMTASIVKKSDNLQFNVQGIECLQNVLGFKKGNIFVDIYNNEYEIIDYNGQKFNKDLNNNEKYAIYLMAIFPNQKQKISIKALKNILKNSSDEYCYNNKEKTKIKRLI